MLNKKTSILIMGFGSIGKRHYLNLHHLGYQNIVIFDPVDTAFQDFKKTERIKEINQKILQDFQVAFICNPNHLHIKTALICAQAGCDLFIEKPLSHNLQNIKILQTLCQKKKLINLVGCNMRFHPCIQFIKNYLDTNKLGKIYSINLEYGQYLPYWRPNQDYKKNYAAKKETGGGIILDDIHEFDLLFWLNNMEEVIKSKFIFDKVSNLQIDTEDICIASFQFKNQVLGLVQCDYLQKNYTRKCKIIGEKGNLEWDFKENIVWLKTKKENKKLLKIRNYNFNNVYVNEVKYFFHCLEKKQKTFNNIQIAYNILKYCVNRK